MKSPFLRKDKEDPEVKREDKQVKRNVRLKKMKSKGKTETKRYKKLKEKVYNPFPEETLGRRKSIKEFKKGYMDRTTKNTGTRFETKVTPEQNLAEYTRERREFYWDGKNVSLLPTDDADRPITKGIKKRNLGENFK